MLPIEPDIEIVDRARNADTALVDGDCMTFRSEEDPMNWDDIAKDFVLEMKNKRI